MQKKNLKHLKNCSSNDKLKKNRISQLKFCFSISTVVLALVAVIAALVTIIFSAGIVTPTMLTLASITGLVGVSTAFYQLDQALGRYLNSLSEKKSASEKIKKLIKKVEKLKELISKGITTLKSLAEKNRNIFFEQLFLQIKNVNDFVEKFNRALPRKIGHVSRFDPFPLLEIVKIGRGGI